VDDGMLVQLDRARFTRVLAPKVTGAWNLHLLTQQAALDFFVLFSSGASLLGSPGQGNHAAANAFLDSLAHHRRSQGKPALSINWGPWTEIGQAAARAGRGDRLAFQGLSGITPEQGLTVLGQLLHLGSTGAKSDDTPVQVGVLPLDLRRWRQFYPRAARAPFLARLAQESDGAAGGDGHDGQIRAALLAAEPGPQRRTLLESYLRDQVGQVLRLDPARIDTQTALATLGFDSLMGLELRNRLEAGLSITLPATLIWNYPTIAVLVPHLAAKSGLSLEVAQQREQSSDEESTQRDLALNRLQDLSDEETEALLLAKLRTMRATPGGA
jgi:myxalamid-type polyketide synthase MxaE and MxaD